MVIRKKPTQAVLANLYQVIRTIFDDEEFYYSLEQIEELKKDKSNIFLTEKGKK